MSFLLDTNVISEPLKPRPDVNVLRWLDEANENELFISVVTFAELRSGIDRLAPSARQRQFEDWYQNELPFRFDRRILSIDPVVADACGRIVARREQIGRRIEVMDAFIAATAEVHGLTLVTRDVTHFQPTTSSLVNPWIPA